MFGKKPTIEQLKRMISALSDEEQEALKTYLVEGEDDASANEAPEPQGDDDDRQDEPAKQDDAEQTTHLPTESPTKPMPHKMPTRNRPTVSRQTITCRMMTHRNRRSPQSRAQNYRH